MAKNDPPITMRKEHGYQRANWRAWAFSAIVLAISVWIVQSSHTFQDCVREHRQHYTSQNFKERISNFMRSAAVRKDCVGEFIHENGEAVTASFTIVLAISTILLWLATKALWEAGERQIKLSRSVAAVQARNTRRQLAIAEAANEYSHQIFTATQRPWVSVAGIEPIGSIDFDAGMQIPFELEIKNGGQTPAINVNWNCSTWIRFMGGSPQELQASFAAELVRDRPVREGANIGHLLLPGAVLKTGTLTHMWHDLPDDPTGFQVIIVGCLDYRFPGEGTYHQTGFMFQLAKKRTNGEPGDFGQTRRTFHINSVFPADAVEFEAFPSGYFAT
jgi:hypothetical protein